MTLEIRQIVPQVEAMEQRRAGQVDAFRQSVEAARACLHKFSGAFDKLQAQVAATKEVQEKQRFGWLGASPTFEPLDASHPLPECPARVTVIGSDGSQIHPDRHAPVLYALVNVGCIVYRHGTGQPPHTYTRPTLYYDWEDLFDEQGRMWPPSVLNARRDLAETEALLRLGQNYKEADVPLIALNDGQLPFWSLDLPYSQQLEQRAKHIRLLDELREQHVLVAGYVDRPRSTRLVNLLHVAQLDKIDKDTLRENPFGRLIDLDILDFLGPGERSSLFVIESQANVDYTKQGHQVHFFYLNVGSEGEPATIARVEIPSWVALDPARLNVLHAALVRQARLTGGFLYVLTRAHELAIISQAERQTLERMMIIQTPAAAASAKAFQKTWLGRRGRHRP